MTQHGELTVTQNGDHITATYQEYGICVGKIYGNKVEGVWKNNKDQGLFEWIFDGDESFKGKYKSGLEHGTMRGKWEGKLNTVSSDSNGNDTNNRILLEIYLKSLQTK